MVVFSRMLYSGDYICYFFFNDTATTEIYTLSLHDALPILGLANDSPYGLTAYVFTSDLHRAMRTIDDIDFGEIYVNKIDRKSTRLNSSHANISYAVFCLKKKKKNQL